MPGTFNRAPLRLMPRLPARLYGPRYWPTWLGLALVRLAASLPLGAMLVAGRWLGAFARRLPLPYRHVARRNIGLCFPSWTEAERAALDRKSTRLNSSH